MNFTFGIIEHKRMIRERVFNYLGKQREFSGIFQTNTLEEFLVKRINSPLDIIICDINPDGQVGVESASILKSLFPSAEIIMFTEVEKTEEIFHALQSGASGYLLKSTTPEKIHLKLLNLMNGEALISPVVAKQILKFFQPQNKQESLTSREQEIVQGLIDGLSFKLIGKRLGISESTARNHSRNVYRKMGVNSKSQVIAKMLRRG